MGVRASNDLACLEVPKNQFALVVLRKIETGDKNRLSVGTDGDADDGVLMTLELRSCSPVARFQTITLPSSEPDTPV